MLVPSPDAVTRMLDALEREEPDNEKTGETEK